MDVTEWLLESDPAIRWQVMRDLLGAPADAVAAERSRVATEGVGARLLALQADDGYWGDHEYGEDGDRRGTHWILQDLRRIGVDSAAPQVRAAVDRVRDGVTWRWWEHRPYFHGEVEECVNGGVLAHGAYFGELGEGSDRIIGMLLEQQLLDGGWNCDPPEESTRSSFDSTLCVIEGFLAYERAVPDAPAAIAESRRRGEEYLLERGLFRRRSTGEVVDPAYLDFAFPYYWHYDVLRALDYFRRLGAGPDPRMSEAVEVVRSKRQPDGRWLLGRVHPGRVHFDLEGGVGAPSRWNTLRALRVLDWWDQRR